MRTCENLIELTLTEQVATLIGKKSTLDQDERIKFQEDLIKQLLKNVDKNAKTAEARISKFEVELDQFPQLVHSKKQSSIRYHLSNFLTK